MLELLDLYLRVAGITLLLLFTALIIRDAWHIRPARFGALLAFILTGVLASTTPTQGFSVPISWRYIVNPMSSVSIIFIWWFCLSLFIDDFRLRRLEWSVAALWTGLGLINIGNSINQLPIDHEWASHIRLAISIMLAAHIVYVALKGRPGDLVEKRRRARIFIAIAVTGLFLFDVIGERFHGYYTTPLLLHVVQLTVIVAVIIWTSLWLLRFDGATLAFEKRIPAEPDSATSLLPKERALRSRLITEMEESRVYLDPELSIGALAARIDAPEHQLRALINKALGHRNFRSFLNGYRMTAAKAALSDPAKADQPILTIAMDSGFASLASFNRAFKKETDATPSDFRKQALTQNSHSQK